jgi:hypothetical protein
MMSRIDPTRRSQILRRAARPAADKADEASEAAPANLPVPVRGARAIPPRLDLQDGGSEFAAQLMGQDGQRRGLRAGPNVIDVARHSYNRVEWSGSKDRRARQGRAARTEA